MTLTNPSLVRSALTGIEDVLSRLSGSWTVARVNPDLPAALLAGSISTDVVAGLPDTRHRLAARGRKTPQDRADA